MPLDAVPAGSVPAVPVPNIETPVGYVGRRSVGKG